MLEKNTESQQVHLQKWLLPAYWNKSPLLKEKWKNELKMRLMGPDYISGVIIATNANCAFHNVNYY